MGVFVTDANLGSSLNVMRSLTNKGIDVVTGDVTSKAASFYSKYIKNKIIYSDPNNQEKFIKSILLAKDIYNFDVIFPMSDITVKPIIKYKKEIEGKGIIVPTPEYRTFKVAHDKLSTYNLAIKNGISAPKTIIPKNKYEIIKFSKEYGFPIVVKARNLTGGRGIFYVNNKYQLLSTYNKLNKISDLTPLLQEHIPGRHNVYSVPTIFDKNKNFVTSMVLRKIRESPITGGTATFAETAYFPELIYSSKKLLNNLGWIGIATPEFKIDPRDNIPKLMEINPRFFGYTKLAISSGLDLPYILYNSFKGNSLDNYLIYNLSFSRLLHDIFILYKEITESGLTFSNRIFRFIEFINTYQKQKIVFDYLSLIDIKPFFYSYICTIGREFNLIKKPYEKIKKRW